MFSGRAGVGIQVGRRNVESPEYNSLGLEAQQAPLRADLAPRYALTYARTHPSLTSLNPQHVTPSHL